MVRGEGTGAAPVVGVIVIEVVFGVVVVEMDKGAFTVVSGSEEEVVAIVINKLSGTPNMSPTSFHCSLITARNNLYCAEGTNSFRWMF